MVELASMGRHGQRHDGIFGEGARVWWPEVAKEQATLWIAVRWWLRNPFHNLFTRTFAGQ